MHSNKCIQTNNQSIKQTNNCNDFAPYTLYENAFNYKYIGTVWWSFWSVLSGFMSECESASTAETVCTHFWIVIVPWPYPDRTQPKLTQNSVSLSTVALPVYQSTMRSLTIVFTIFGTHNNDVQGVGTHLLFRFLHWRKIVFKIKKKKTDFKVKITW